MEKGFCIVIGMDYDIEYCGLSYLVKKSISRFNKDSNCEVVYSSNHMNKFTFNFEGHIYEFYYKYNYPSVYRVQFYTHETQSKKEIELIYKLKEEMNNIYHNEHHGNMILELDTQGPILRTGEHDFLGLSFVKYHPHLTMFLYPETICSLHTSLFINNKIVNYEYLGVAITEFIYSIATFPDMADDNFNIYDFYNIDHQGNIVLTNEINSTDYDLYSNKQVIDLLNKILKFYDNTFKDGSLKPSIDKLLVYDNNTYPDEEAVASVLLEHMENCAKILITSMEQKCISDFDLYEELISEV
ncbi:MAG: hypothetical protein OCD02_11350 [Spirochaetaceae bacterium]